MLYSISVPKDVNILASYGAEPRKFKAGVHHGVPSEYALHPYAVACGVKVLDTEDAAPFAQKSDAEIMEDVKAGAVALGYVHAFPAAAEAAIAAQAKIDFAYEVKGLELFGDDDPDADREMGDEDASYKVSPFTELAAKGETKDELIAQAAELGLTVDKRWGLAKLHAAIDAALAA
jgi:hypothetical protein